MAKQFNLNQGQRAERKTLITVAEWDDYEVLASQPDDWSTNYTSYYTKSGDAYIPVTGSVAPSFSASTYYEKSQVRELLGTRVADSSIEYNTDIETTTDIRGNTYSDINKTEPQQDFDPYPIMGGSKLAVKLNDIRRRNAVSELSQFTCYIITAFAGTVGFYETEKQTNCTILYTSLGGDSYVNFNISVRFSNNITLGTVDKLAEDFEFTADVAV